MSNTNNNNTNDVDNDTDNNDTSNINNDADDNLRNTSRRVLDMFEEVQNRINNSNRLLSNLLRR